MLFLTTLIILLIFARLGSQAIDEAQIREQLQAEAFHGATVVEYHVISSVPLSVQLIVQSDHQITPAEVEAAQTLINELYRQEVYLTVVARKVVRPLEPAMAAIWEQLRDVFPRAQIADVWVERADGFVLHAILQNFTAPSRAKLKDAKRRISQIVDEDARLEVIYQRKLAVGGRAAAGS